MFVYSQGERGPGHGSDAGGGRLWGFSSDSFYFLSETRSKAIDRMKMGGEWVFEVCRTEKEKV